MRDSRQFLHGCRLLMPKVIDLTQQRCDGPFKPLWHPAGVALPFDGALDAALIIPDIRREVRSGDYVADTIKLLDQAVRPGDRVLVIGAGLGVLTTLIAKRGGVERLIAVEANTQLVHYLERTHALNGVEWIETINAALAEDRKGYVPFFARQDIRTSSLLPDHGSWQQVMMVPTMDLDAILMEEQITLLVSEIPSGTAEVLASANPAHVERILLSAADDPAGTWAKGGALERLAARAQRVERNGVAALLVVAVAPVEAASRESRATEAGRGGRRTRARIEIGSNYARILRDPERAGWWERQVERTAQQSLEPNQKARKWGVSKEPVSAGSETDRAAATESGTAETEVGGGARMVGDEALAYNTEESQAREAIKLPPEPRFTEAASNSVARPVQDRRREHPAKGHGAGTTSETARDRGSRQLWSLFAILLLLALPLILVSRIAAERADVQRQTVQQIEAAWGGAHTLTGPLMVIPVEAPDRNSTVFGRGAAMAENESVRSSPIILLPEILQIDSELETETIRRDLFEAIVYRSRNNFRVVADPAPLAAQLADGEVVRWDEAILSLGISEPHGLMSARLLSGGLRPIEFRSGSGIDGLSGIHAPIGDSRGQDMSWQIVLELSGSRHFRITPAGRLTEWRMRSDSSHPQFDGRFGPAIQQTGTHGFVAEWTIPRLAFPLPQAFRGIERLQELQGGAFGVDLVHSADLYQTVDRAAKLGFILIAATLAAAFLVARTVHKQIDVMQYALIGTVECAFFLLLLALAERIGFSIAYALVAAAAVTLLTAHSWVALKFGRRSGWVATVLLFLFSGMYMVLMAEQYALIAVSVLIFLAVGAAMWATRNMELAVAPSVSTEREPTAGNSAHEPRFATNPPRP